MFEAKRSSQQVCVMAVGDSLIEPFWPEGLGINRGFHSALDAVRQSSVGSDGRLVTKTLNCSRDRCGSCKNISTREGQKTALSLNQFESSCLES